MISLLLNYDFFTYTCSMLKWFMTNTESALCQRNLTLFSKWSFHTFSNNFMATIYRCRLILFFFLVQVFLYCFFPWNNLWQQTRSLYNISESIFSAMKWREIKKYASACNFYFILTLSLNIGYMATLASQAIKIHLRIWAVADPRYKQINILILIQCK